jgi:hypothetical protein
VHDLSVELGPRAAQQLQDGVLVTTGRNMRAFAGHRYVRLDDSDDPRL